MFRGGQSWAGGSAQHPTPRGRVLSCTFLWSRRWLEIPTSPPQWRENGDGKGRRKRVVPAEFWRSFCISSLLLCDKLLQSKAAATPATHPRSWIYGSASEFCWSKPGLAALSWACSRVLELRSVCSSEGCLPGMSRGAPRNKVLCANKSGSQVKESLLTHWISHSLNSYHKPVF